MTMSLCEGLGAPAGQPDDPTHEPAGARDPVARVHHLSNIQILRGVAAVMVLVYHIMNELQDRGFEGYIPNLGAGSGGVDIFFVISGFIMVYASVPAFGKAGASGCFLLRRIVRLVPLYWTVTTIFVILAVHEARHGGVPAGTLRWFAASYGFLFYTHDNAGDFPLYAQGWTLNFEMFFYLCFAFALPWRRSVAVAALSVGFGLFTIAGLATALPWPADRWSNTNIVEFVFGMLLAEAHLRGLRLTLPVATTLAAAGLAFMVLTEPSVDDWLPYRGFVWGPPATMIVAAAACYQPTAGGVVRTALEALGDASYSLYLVHVAFFIALATVLGRFGDVLNIPPALYAFLLFFGAVAAAFVTYQLFERPVTRLLNRTLGLSRRWRAITGAAGAGP